MMLVVQDLLQTDKVDMNLMIGMDMVMNIVTVTLLDI
jgi:hypothetical protein